MFSCYQAVRNTITGFARYSVLLAALLPACATQQPVQKAVQKCKCECRKPVKKNAVKSACRQTAGGYICVADVPVSVKAARVPNTTAVTEVPSDVKAAEGNK
jgi:hypothetical protein